jgi:hypothetical protein
VLYLTATLPPSEEAAFHEAVGVPEREMFTLRDLTIRPNIAYAVVGYEKLDKDEAVRRLAGRSRSERAEHRGGARLLRSLRTGFCSLRSARPFRSLAQQRYRWKRTLNHSAQKHRYPRSCPITLGNADSSSIVWPRPDHFVIATALH